MARSSWKNKFVDNKILHNIILNNKNYKYNNSLKIFSRSSTILKTFLNNDFHVYNGIMLKKLKININMIGQKFGEFYYTHKSPKHPKLK